MASLVRCSTWEISSLFFPSRSLLFFRVLCLHYAQEKSHVSHIFNNFIAANMLKSRNPLKKNGGICLEHTASERARETRRRMWNFLPFAFFFFLHHLSGFYFALALGVLINVLPLPFLAFEYYEPNITITAHYPRSYKTKAIAMTKWLLCGCGPFFGSFVLLMERAVILFIHFYYESHTNTHTHIRTYSHSPSPKTKRRFINLLFLWITYFCLCVEKQFPPVQHRLPLGKLEAANANLPLPSTAKTCIKLNMSTYHLSNSFLSFLFLLQFTVIISEGALVKCLDDDYNNPQFRANCLPHLVSQFITYENITYVTCYLDDSKKKVLIINMFLRIELWKMPNQNYTFDRVNKNNSKSIPMPKTFAQIEQLFFPLIQLQSRKTSKFIKVEINILLGKHFS